VERTLSGFPIRRVKLRGTRSEPGRVPFNFEGLNDITLYRVL